MHPQRERTDTEGFIKRAKVLIYTLFEHYEEEIIERDEKVFNNCGSGRMVRW